mmetsp:Transcript_36982/g.89852  ORF Transcript_36982/g.89852 Transcript_36982/m.89852 type:complete len:319 (+) Transcript_36982:943-1899(+)
MVTTRAQKKALSASNRRAQEEDANNNADDHDPQQESAREEDAQQNTTSGRTKLYKPVPDKDVKDNPTHFVNVERGRASECHPGNLAWRNRVRMSYMDYAGCCHQELPKLQFLLEFTIAADRAGITFIKRLNKYNIWVVVEGRELVEDYVGQCFESEHLRRMKEQEEDGQEPPSRDSTGDESADGNIIRRNEEHRDIIISLTDYQHSHVCHDIVIKKPNPNMPLGVGVGAFVLEHNSTLEYTRVILFSGEDSLAKRHGMQVGDWIGWPPSDDEDPDIFRFATFNEACGWARSGNSTFSVRVLRKKPVIEQEDQEMIVAE